MCRCHQSARNVANPSQSYRLLNINISNQIWHAPVAASLLGGMLVLLFNLLSCAILIRWAPRVRALPLWVGGAHVHSVQCVPPRRRCQDDAGLLPASAPRMGGAPPAPRNNRKSIDKRGPGLGYGFVVAMCFTLSFFVLLCGLVLDGFSDVVKQELEVKLADSWSKYNTGV